MSTSKTGRPSSIPVAVGSIAGCEGGAVMGGNIEGSGPSSTYGSMSGVDTARAAGAVTFGVARGLELGALVGVS
jgi:hypothetical protein